VTRTKPLSGKIGKKWKFGVTISNFSNLILFLTNKQACCNKHFDFILDDDMVRIYSFV